MSVLKTDLFGRIERRNDGDLAHVLRDTRSAPWWTTPLARHLLRRERRALTLLAGLPRIPRLIDGNAVQLRREWIEGLPLHRAPRPDARYFREALRLVRQMYALPIGQHARRRNDRPDYRRQKCRRQSGVAGRSCRNHEVRFTVRDGWIHPLSRYERHQTVP